jgi:hypothetical protein
MLWLILIAVGAVLLFVLFAKPAVNTTGLERSSVVPIEPARPPSQAEPVVAPPPADVSSVHFNDVFAPKKSHPNNPSV